MIEWLGNAWYGTSHNIILLFSLTEDLQQSRENRETDVQMANPGMLYASLAYCSIWLLYTSTMSYYCSSPRWNSTRLVSCDPSIVVTWLLWPLPAEAMPGNIRRAQHFLGFMKRFIEYLKVSKLLGFFKMFMSGGGVTSCHMTSVGYECSMSLRRHHPTSSTSSSRRFALRGSPFVSAQNDFSLSSPPSRWWTSATSPPSL